MNKTKKCSKCGEYKPANVEYYGKDKKNKDGLRGLCRVCYSEQQKKYYNENKKKILNYKKQYYLDNADKILERDRIYQEKNAEKIRAYKRQYKKENRDLFNSYKQKRKAKKDKLPATLTAQQWEATKKAFDYGCAYCGMFEERHLQEFGENLHQDHFVPLSKGGGYTLENIVPACRRCNSSKGDRLFEEWYPNYEFYDRKREIRILTFLRKQQALAM